MHDGQNMATSIDSLRHAPTPYRPDIDGLPIFRDAGSHYTEHASTRVAEAFAKWAEQNALALVGP